MTVLIMQSGQVLGIVTYVSSYGRTYTLRSVEPNGHPSS